MSRTTSTLEDRLARYRPMLDDAIADRTALTASDRPLADFDLIELNWQPVGSGLHPSSRSRLLVGASAVVLIGGLAVVVATRDTPPQHRRPPRHQTQHRCPMRPCPPMSSSIPPPPPRSKDRG